MAVVAPERRPLLASLPKSRSSASLQSLKDGDDSELESGFEDLRNKSGFWQRLRMAIRRRNTPGSKTIKPRQGIENKNLEFKSRRVVGRTCVLFSLFIVIIVGIIHFFNIFLDQFPVFLDDSAVPDLDWNIPNQALLDITRDVTPIPCHSHNDYWRRVPLYDALRSGCTGVEADVWLFDEELHVGHSTHTLTRSRTLRSMYVDPLVKLLDHQNQAQPPSSPGPKNGLFPKSPSETVVLLIDFKNDGHALYPIVSAHLAALRAKNYLTTYNGVTTTPGPITVVATGNAPFNLILANTTHRDIFFDAPLDTFSPTIPPSPRTPQATLGTTPSPHFHFNPTNSFYASTNFGRSIGWLWFGRVSPAQLRLLRAQMEGARARGLKPRYWSAPAWPVGRRDAVWRVLVREGVGYLNGDDLGGMTRVWRDVVGEGGRG